MLRHVAFERVALLQRLYDNEIPWGEIEAGVLLEGTTVPISTKAEGIYKPQGHPAALSIKTTVPRAGRANPYSDELIEDGRLLRYAYRARGGPANPANESLRLAMSAQLPLIYFFGVAPAVYAALLPVYVVGDDPLRHEFKIAPSSLHALGGMTTDVQRLLEASPDRAYVARVVMQRLHQRTFRAQVLRAYDHHCAMCSIHFDEFLDAAHIVPDSDPLGVPEVHNGLALCGLHHRAFDRFLVDIDDDYRVRVSPELLRRRDGPIFEGAFLRRHGESIHLPSRVEHRPERGLLQARRAWAPAGLWPR